jgi:E3 ubiquitin-protein ligase DOA10
MNAVFASMRDPTVDQQKKMNEILMGGREKQKRLYSVDESIYGTEEGKASLEVAEREMKKAERLRKKKNKKKGIDNNKTVDDSSTMTSGVDSSTIIKSSAIAVTCLGLVAAGASLFLGGNKRS